MEIINTATQRVQWTQNTRGMKETKPNWIIIKLLKMSDKDRGTKIKMTAVLSSGKCQIEDGERILKHSKKNNYQLKILYPTKISSKKKVNWTVSRHTNAERMYHQHTCITRNAQRSPLSGRKYWMDLDLQKEMVIVSKYKDSFLII